MSYDGATTQPQMEADLRALETLHDLSMRLVTEENVQTIYEEILDAAILLTLADAGTVQIMDEGRSELVLLAHRNFEPGMTSRFERVGAGSNTGCGVALRTGERTFIDFDQPVEEDPDGSLRVHVEAGYLSAQSTPLVARSGKPIGMFSTHWRERNHRPSARQLRHLDLLARQAADLIELRRSEKALRESEEHLHLILESVEDYAIITINFERKINRWNRGAEKIFGWTRQEVTGQRADVVLTQEDRAARILEREIETAIDAGVAPCERLFVRKDGGTFFGSGMLSALRKGREIVGFVKIIRDTTERMKAEKALRERELLQQLVHAQEDERRRIARDLHDELGQQLTALRLKLDSAGKIYHDHPVTEQIEEVKSIAARLDDGVDFLAWELRPAALDDLGLYFALDKYVSEWSRHSGVPAELHASGLEEERFPSEVETNLYRIVQEALNNINKHAAAEKVGVIVEKRGDLVVLIVADDGDGFRPEDKYNRSKGIGLIGIEERARLIGGAFEIESSPGEGTTLYVRVPFDRAH